VFKKGKLFVVVAATFALNTPLAFAGTINLATSGTTLVNNQPSVVHSSTKTEIAVQVEADHNESELNRSTIHHVARHDGSDSQCATVQKGQTLWSISRQYGVSVTSLERWNHLSDDSVLQIGQNLIVGDGTSSTAKSANGPSSRDGSVDLGVEAAAEGLDVTNYAQKYLGVPYAWGGSSPSGFDCSGFTMFVYRHFGLNLPHTSYEQYNHGTSVSQSQLRAGDLVFFSTAGDGASHVGIYVGQGKFINAAGNSIRYSSISDGYWASNYVGARRVLNG
jgi:peptidoglycan DL-endopeptidase LytE